MYRKIVLLFFLFCSVGLSAQTEATFSLAQAREFALQHSYLLQSGSLDVTKAQKRVWEAISTGLPQVSATGAYNKFLDLPVSLVPGEFFGGEPGSYVPVKFGQDYSSDYGFTASQMIFDGSYIVGVTSSKVYLDLTKRQLEKNEIDIQTAVSQAYYLVLVAGDNLKVQQENLANTRKLYTETKAYYETGFREEQDVDQLMILVKNAENEVLRTEREITVSKVVLKYAMGMDVDAPIALTDSLPMFINPLLAAPEQPAFEYSGHIDYRLAQTQLAVSEKLLALEKAAILPKISFFYSWSKTAYGNKANLFARSVDWFPSSLLGLNVSMPLFKSGEQLLKIKQAQITREQSALALDLTSQTLQKDYLTAQANLKNAVEKFSNDRENRELALKIYEKTKIKFNNGIAGSTEVSQNESQYINAHRALIGSILQLLQADLDLRKATGKL